MRKEVLVAIISGIVLGLLVAFGIWRANLTLSSKTPKPQNLNSTQEQSQEIAKSSLVVTQPENLSVVSQEKVLVKGTAEPKSVVLILANDSQQTLEAKQDGNFETEIELSGGPNEILVKSFNDQGVEAEQKITVVYSTEFEE